jgi:hypothetical protein
MKVAFISHFADLYGADRSLLNLVLVVGMYLFCDNRISSSELMGQVTEVLGEIYRQQKELQNQIILLCGNS